MKKHSSGKTPLLLVCSNDIRKKPDSGKKDEKVLTDEQKQDYFQCVELILDAISDENKAQVLKETDSEQKNALMWCCKNANIQSVCLLHYVHVIYSVFL